MRHLHPRFHPAPLALSIALALAAPGLAQAQTADGGRAVALSIAAQPLGAALHQLSVASGVPIAFAPALVAGRAAPAVMGKFTPSQALERLLAGSGLVAAPEGEAIVIRAAAPAGAAATLAEVKVVAQTEKNGATEGSGSYQATYSNTATKLDLSPRETPQTVTVVTRQQMDDFGMTSVDDALKQTSGVSVIANGLNTNGNTFYSRGFALQSQWDGVPNPIGISESNRNPSLDSAFLDRVEILQGASGLLAGAGNPGGTINLVRKQPTKEFQAQAEVQLGSWNKRRLVGDVSGSIDESGRVRSRLVALADDSDSFVDYVYNNRRAVYGVVEADLTATTTVSASVQYQKDKGRGYYGVPHAPDGSDLGFSRSTFFGNVNSHTDKESTIYSLALAQALPSDWKLKASYNHYETIVDVAGDGWFTGTLNVATGSGLSWYGSRALQRSFKSDSLDAFVSGPVSFFNRTHEFALGVNGSRTTESSYNAGNVKTPIDNIYAFNPHAFTSPLGTPFSNDENTRQLGIYGVGRFSLTDSLKAIVGARLSWYEYKNAGVTTQKEDNVVSPYAGLVYDINKQYSAYLSYSDIFMPQSLKNATGKTIDPVMGKNYELGIKGELIDGKLNVAAAIFRLEQSNLALLDSSIPYNEGNACGGYCYTAADKVVSQGADFSINGQIQPGWNVAAGYTYVNSEYATGTNEGEPYGTYRQPKHSATVSTNYRIPSSNWSIGGSVRAYSRIYMERPTWSMERGTLFLVGLTAKYQITPKADLIFIADNIFDRTYYASIDSRWSTTYGEPRKFSVNLKYRF